MRLTSRLLAVAVLAAAVAVPGTAGAAPARPWVAGWATAPQHPMPGADWQGPNWSMEGFADQSVRQVVRVTAAGSRVRIRLSNQYGTAPLRLAGATVAKAGDGPAVLPGTVRRLTFGRSASTVISAGGSLASDDVHLKVDALDKLTVTLYFAVPTGPATFHETGLTTTWRAAGDHLFDQGGFTDGGSHSWYFLSGVDVSGGSRGTVVAFGDSITDGVFSTANTDRRYPDRLAARLAGTHRRLGVVNAGISGNRVLSDTTCFGESALHRFRRDALDQPGVRTVIVLEGINDIGTAGTDFGCGPSPVITADDLIAGHRRLIRAAHERGVRVLGATMTPVKGNQYGYDTPEKEAIRDAVNTWIRTSGEYDGVVDLDRALSDPADPDAMRTEYDGGDGLHPKDAGMQAIADAVDLALL
ncbi:SGNH/GDSL hydrolase family protein [Longispora albida]|uniref:SGNH/GDSL hydrolase family protein n=1 Tax=Longispora albida TaxID=203523 RepID=UPI0003A68FDB|nr:SGNH/GDSL hydrolase family protein [Longispora albida]